MNYSSLVTATGILTLLLFTTSVSAQQTPPAPTPPPAQPQPPAKPEKPPKPVKDLIKDFQAERDAYLTEQRRLQRLLKKATAEERAAIREQIKESLAQWRQDQRDRAAQIREQIDGLKQKTDLAPIADAAKEDAKNRGR